MVVRSDRSRTSSSWELSRAAIPSTESAASSCESTASSLPSVAERAAVEGCDRQQVACRHPGARLLVGELTEPILGPDGLGFGRGVPAPALELLVPPDGPVEGVGRQELGDGLHAFRSALQRPVDRSVHGDERLEFCHCEPARSLNRLLGLL